MRRRLKGFEVEKTGYIVSNLRSEKHGNLYHYYFNLNTPSGRSNKKKVKADNLTDLKKKILYNL